MDYFRKNSGTGSKKQASTPIRMKIILGIIFILFALLIGQLAYLQLAYGSRFKSEVAQNDSTVVSNQVPRGVMYDSKGRVLVGNKANNAITYTKGESTSSKQIYQISTALSAYISITDEKPTQEQLAEYYLADTANSTKIEAKLPKSEKGNNVSSTELTQNLIKEVKKEKIKFTKRQKTAALIFNKISGAYTLSTIYIKNKGLTDKELAQVGEHLSDLPGVGIETTGNVHIQTAHQFKVLLVLFLPKNPDCQVTTCSTTWRKVTHVTTGSVLHILKKNMKLC